MMQRSNLNNFMEMNQQQQVQGPSHSSVDEHPDDEDDDGDSMASESIYTRGKDEFHTDAKSMVASVFSGFTNLEISFQKASSVYSAAPLVREVSPAERRLSLYDDIERQISAKAGIEDDWEVEETFDPVKANAVVSKATHSDTSHSSSGEIRNDDDDDDDDESKGSGSGSGSGGTMAWRRYCKISLFILALLAAASLTVVFVVLPRMDGDSSTTSSSGDSSAPASSENSLVPPAVPLSPSTEQQAEQPSANAVNEPADDETTTTEQTTEEETVGAKGEMNEILEPAIEKDPGTADHDGGENENNTAEEQATQNQGEAWGGILDALTDFASQCEDSDETFRLDQIDRTCDYLLGNLPAQTIACRPDGAAWEVCRSTCLNCLQD